MAAHYDAVQFGKGKRLNMEAMLLVFGPSDSVVLCVPGNVAGMY